MTFLSNSSAASLPPRRTAAPPLRECRQQNIEQRHEQVCGRYGAFGTGLTVTVEAPTT